MRKKIKNLEKELNALRTSVDKQEQSRLASVDTHKAQILLIDNREKGVQPLLNQVRKYSRTASVESDVLDFTYLNLDYYALKENKENLFVQRSQFRKKALLDKSFSWKYYANLGLWQDAYLQLEEKIKQGTTLEDPAERVLFRQVFEHTWHQFSSDPSADIAGYFFFRGYLNLRALELANRSFKLNDKPNIKIINKLKPLLEIQSQESMQANVGPNELILSVYNETGLSETPPKLHLILQGQESYLHLQSEIKNASPSIEDVQSLLDNSGIKIWQTAKKIYVVAAGDSFAWQWEKLGRPLAFLPTVDCLPGIKSWQHLPKESTGHLTADSTSKTNAISKANVRRSYQRIKRGNKVIDPLNLKRFNLIHIDEDLYLNNLSPAFSVISTKKYYLSLSSIGELLLKNTALLSYAEVEIDDNKALKNIPDSSQGWIAVALASFAAEVPATILGLSKNKDKEDWQQFYMGIAQESFAETLAKTKIDGRLLGFWGSSAPEELKVAPAAVSQSLVLGENAFAKKRY